MLQRKFFYRLAIFIMIFSAFGSCKKDDGGPSPSISDFSPTDGSPGDLVVINGTNFNPDPTKDAVSFGGVSAEITNASATQITAKVPQQARSGAISVSANGKSISSNDRFAILGGVVITSVSAPSGVAGDIITIKGSGFSSDKTRNVVMIGGAIAEVTEASSTQLTIVVPPNAVGTDGIVVTTSGGTNKLPTFGVHMTVTDFTPTSGPLGTRIKITGTGLSRYYFVSLNNKGLCPSISCTPTELIVAPDGNIGDIGTLSVLENFILQGESSQKKITVNKNFSITDAPPTQMASFPGVDRSYRPTGFAIGSQLFFGLGNDSNGNPLNDFWKYESNSDTWTRIADFPGGARFSVSSFSFNGKGYVIGGITKQSGTQTPQKDVWQYDPQQNKWTQLGNFPGNERGKATCFVIGQYAYFGTGNNKGTFYKDFWRYDPINDSWLRKADFAGGAMEDQAGLAIGNYGYLAAGDNQNSTNVFPWQYDPSNDTWKQLSEYNFPIFSMGPWGHSVGFTLKGIGYVAKDDALYQLIPGTDVSQPVSWVQVQTAARILTPSPTGFGYSIRYLDSGHSLANDTNAYIWYGNSSFWKFTPPN
jgi:N-acetylneuraminic acid mutarotase